MLCRVLNRLGLQTLTALPLDLPAENATFPPAFTVATASLPAALPDVFAALVANLDTPLTVFRAAVSHPIAKMEKAANTAACPRLIPCRVAITYATVSRSIVPLKLQGSSSTPKFSLNNSSTRCSSSADRYGLSSVNSMSCSSL